MVNLVRDTWTKTPDSMIAVVLILKIVYTICVIKHCFDIHTQSEILVQSSKLAYLSLHILFFLMYCEKNTQNLLS